MRTEAEIRARLREIQCDDRLRAKPARVDVNAPLALIQTEGEAACGVLRWVLGEWQGCAGSYPTKRRASAGKDQQK